MFLVTYTIDTGRNYYGGPCVQVASFCEAICEALLLGYEGTLLIPRLSTELEDVDTDGVSFEEWDAFQDAYQWGRRMAKR